VLIYLSEDDPAAFNEVEVYYTRTQRRLRSDWRRSR